LRAETGGEFASPRDKRGLERRRHRIAEREQLAHDGGPFGRRIEPGERGQLRDRQVLDERSFKDTP